MLPRVSVLEFPAAQPGFCERAWLHVVHRSQPVAPLYIDKYMSIDALVPNP
jgi:hypothetical protein